MHQIQIINQACDGNPLPITVQVIGRDHEHKPRLIREVELATDASTTVLLPESSTLIIRENTHAHAHATR